VNPSEAVDEVVDRVPVTAIVLEVVENVPGSDDDPADEERVAVVVVEGAVVVDVVVGACWVNVIGAATMVTPWAWTVTFVVPKGRGKFNVWLPPAGKVTGAGETAFEPLKRIVKVVEPNAATAEAFSVTSTDPPVAVADPAVTVAVDADAAATSKS
jgi:hypothetical protein